MPRNDLIQVRSDTSANWTSVNPILATGEIGFESNTGKFKIGTGSTAWSSLPYTNTATGNSIDDVGGVVITSVAADQFLKYDGTNWVNTTIIASDIPTLNQNTTGTASSVTSAAQSAITSVGTLSSLAVTNGVTAATFTGAWNGTAIAGQYGGTGIDNEDKTITLGGSLTTSGVHTTTLTTTGNTSVTLPTSGTLATTGNLGLVYISSGTFSGATTANLTSVFSSTYDNYRLVISNLQVAATNLYLFCINLLSGSTPAATNYYYALSGLMWSGSTDNYVATSSSLGACGALSNVDSHVVLEICRPFIADVTTISAHNSSTWGNYTGAISHMTASSYNGIQLFDFRLYADASNIAGSWKLYGYKN